MYGVTQKVIPLCLFLALLAGCKANHRYIYESFSVLNTRGGTTPSCSISLRGSEQYIGRDPETGQSMSYFRSPYSVLVSFTFSKENTGTIEFQNIFFYRDGVKIEGREIDLTKKVNEEVILYVGDSRTVKDTTENVVNFLIRGITIPHARMEVVVNAFISTGSREETCTWRFEITPCTEEETRNDQLDSLMSV